MGRRACIAGGDLVMVIRVVYDILDGAIEVVVVVNIERLRLWSGCC